MKKNLSSVFIIIERFFPFFGGAEVQSFQLGNFLSQKGVKVFLITKRYNKEHQRNEEINKNFRVVRLGFPINFPFIDYLNGLILAFYLWKKRGYTSIYFINSGLANIWGSTAILIGKILKKKVVGRIATPGEIFFKGPLALSSKKWVHPLIRIRLRFVKLADFFIAQTSQIKKELLIFGIHSKKIKTIPDGVDEKKFSLGSLVKKKFLREKFGLPLKKIIVIYCGRLVKRKGLITLLGAWRQVVKKTSGAVLVLVGSGENQPDSLEKVLYRLAGKDINKNIFFLGKKDNVYEYLQSSDIFVYPSILAEGTPFSVLEAMSCGLPVVGSNVGGIKDVVKNGETGILVKKENLGDLSLALLTLINNNTLRKEMGRKGRRVIENKYSLGKIMKIYYQTLMKVFKK